MFAQVKISCSFGKDLQTKINLKIKYHEIRNYLFKHENFTRS